MSTPPSIYISRHALFTWRMGWDIHIVKHLNIISLCPEKKAGEKCQVFWDCLRYACIWIENMINVFRGYAYLAEIKLHNMYLTSDECLISLSNIHSINCQCQRNLNRGWNLKYNLLFKLQIRFQKRFSIEFDSSSQFGNKKFERFYSFWSVTHPHCLWHRLGVEFLQLK